MTWTRRLASDAFVGIILVALACAGIHATIRGWKA